LVIGAIVRFEGADDVACVSITAAPQRQSDGQIAAAPIVLLPMTLTAVAGTVTARDGDGVPMDGFTEAFERWQADERGFGCFTVPFEGRLDVMIARQMTVG
jgi:protocatechuate 3,4-dioxygenase beta subunit